MDITPANETPAKSTGIWPVILITALFFFWGEEFLALLHGDRELDSAELESDLERVGVTRVQVCGDQVKLPVVPNIMEG